MPVHGAFRNATTIARARPKATKASGRVSVTFEELHGAFVLLRRGSTAERAEISPTMRVRINLA
jgi:hypothetical protein